MSEMRSCFTREGVLNVCCEYGIACGLIGNVFQLSDLRRVFLCVGWVPIFRVVPSHSQPAETGHVGVGQHWCSRVPALLLPMLAGMRTGFERLAGYSGSVAGSGKEVDATSPAPLSVLHREDDPRARIGRRALSFVRATYPTGHCVPRVARFFLCVYH